jgi:hypothetical protein
VINESPSKMIAAGQEIKLITEVAVAIVKVAVKNQLGGREHQDNKHAIVTTRPSPTTPDRHRYAVSD